MRNRNVGLAADEHTERLLHEHLAGEKKRGRRGERGGRRGRVVVVVVGRESERREGGE
jgi:hypothetical protein